VAEDFPNGGGNRGFLFVVDGPDGRFSWFFQNSASAVDLHLPIIVGGKNFGAPIDNLRAAMKDAGLESVDLWIGSGGAQVAAEAMPYITHRRPECNTGRPHPWQRAASDERRFAAAERIAGPECSASVEPDRGPRSPNPARLDPSAWNTWSERRVSRTSIEWSP
jgi:hypothetical protein